MRRFLIILTSFMVCLSSCNKKAGKPAVTTEAVSNVSQTAATSGGTVTSDGSSEVTSRGVCWGTDENPTTANFTSINGSGTGTFSSEISGLESGKTYHLRAFAINKMGTSYGSDIQFITTAVSSTDSNSSSNNTVMEGQAYTDNNTATWNGVSISRSKPVSLIFRNNSITSVNSVGYLLQAGDEAPANSNNNLDGEAITGNNFVWNGADKASTITHGIFTGYNINVLIKYNYLFRVPTGIVLKSNGMTYTAGGVFYNIINQTGTIAIAVKGTNGVRIYNNTFYSNEVKFSDKSKPGTSSALVDIFSNDGLSNNPDSKGTKIKNNIFYTVNQIANVSVQNKADLEGFECDYNVYWCEKGDPVFGYLGTQKTFAEWQALGFDTHSVVMNPNFKDLTGFVPTARIDRGTDLGPEFQTGLSNEATWTVGSAPATNNQNGPWQVGARIW